ncbi:hypothetical protein PQQ51_06720 [Paraburkholderia xenovorans]|uniref:hypothetical protein n=1 Tax=Paraburkholderia xenovorans TaxID=36873 RepID=UPI0038B8E4B8
MSKMSASGRLAAFENVKRSVNVDTLLPSLVFAGTWAKFFFCESDRIFGAHFVGAVTELMRLEGGTVACLANLDLTPVSELAGFAAIYVDRATTTEQYRDALQAGGPQSGWLYRMDRYACASDAGSWCIYCEKSNDVAVIALRDNSDADWSRGPLTQLWAKPIEELVDGGSSPLFPFDMLVPDWRKGLIDTYGNGPSHDGYDG